jgi:carboxypeptidase C (cathepsin A)
MSIDVIALEAHNTVVRVTYTITGYFPGDSEQPEELPDIEVIRVAVVSYEGDPDEFKDYKQSSKFYEDITDRLRYLEGLY